MMMEKALKWRKDGETVRQRDREYSFKLIVGLVLDVLAQIHYPNIHRIGVECKMPNLAVVMTMMMIAKIANHICSENKKYYNDKGKVVTQTHNRGASIVPQSNA